MNSLDNIINNLRAIHDDFEENESKLRNLEIKRENEGISKMKDNRRDGYVMVPATVLRSMVGLIKTIDYTMPDTPENQPKREVINKILDDLRIDLKELS